MMAWVSPSATVRLTPRRISRLPPSLSVTSTCRSRISRVDTFRTPSLSRNLGIRGDEDVVALDLHCVDRHRLRRREPGRLAGAQVEARVVQPALDRETVDLALRERDGGVRAPVADREDLTLGADDRDLVVVDLDRQDAALGDVG